MIEKMDDIGEANKNYKTISSISTGIYIIIVQFYLLLLSNDIDILNVMSFNNVIIRGGLELAGQALIFASIYHLTRFFYSAYWIKKNSKLWIKGTWLHIHVKNNVRVGKVEIYQDFKLVKAEGYNIDLFETSNSPNIRATRWSYLLSKVVDDESPRDFLGCYEAQELDGDHIKDGVHTLTIVKWDKKNKKPLEIHGCFRDTIKLSKQRGESYLEDAGNNSGQLFLYKLNNSLKSELYDDEGFNYDKLSKILESQNCENEVFVQKLKSLIHNR